MTDEKDIVENTSVENTSVEIQEATENTENTSVEAHTEQPTTEVLAEYTGENATKMVKTEDLSVKPSEKLLSEPERISSKHFKRVNQEKELLKRQNEELARQLEAQRYAQQPIDTRVSPDNSRVDDFNIDENNFAEGKDLKRIVNEMRDLKKELHQYKHKTALEVTEARLNNEFPDFKSGFSDENIELFKAEYPEIAESLINSNAEPYKVAKSMFLAMKRFGIVAEEPTKKVTQDKERVQANLSKPRPVASVTARQGNSPLSKAGEYADDELTEERKAALRAEVERYCR